MRKFLKIWLVFENATAQNQEKVIGKYYADDASENPQPGRYLESFFNGYLQNYWRKNAYTLLEKVLQTIPFNITDVKSIFLNYDEYPITGIHDMHVMKDHILYLGEIDFEYDLGLHKRINAQYEKASNVEQLKRIFKDTPFDYLDYRLDNSQKNILHISIEKNNLKFTEELIKHGFSVKQPTTSYHPIYLAKTVEMAQLLIDYGANIHEPLWNGANLIYQSAIHQNIDLLRFYSDKGLNIVWKNEHRGWNLIPFWAILDNNSIPCLDFYLQNGMDINIKDLNNKTLLDIVDSYMKYNPSSYDKIREFIVSRGGKRMIAD